MFRSRSRVIASLIAFAYTRAHATCYYYDGTSADTDVPCGYETNYCCPEGDTCVSNGLCQDKNNYLNRSLTYFSNDENPGPYNYTGLYASASCTSSDWTGCSSYCVKAESAKTESQDEYVWACNSDLTSFCCHDDNVALDNGNCCDGTTFSLQSALVDLNETTSTTSSSKTSSSARSSQRTDSISTSGISSSTATKPAAIILTVAGTSTPSTWLISTTSPPSSSATTISNTNSSIESGTIATTVSSSISLSPAVKAGIAVGAAAAAISVIGFFLFWRHRRSRKVNPVFKERKVDPVFKEQMREPLYPSHLHFFADKAEIQGQEVNEVHGYSMMMPRELPGNQLVELPAVDCRTPELSGSPGTRESRRWSWKSGSTHL